MNRPLRLVVFVLIPLFGLIRVWLAGLRRAEKQQLQELELEQQVLLLPKIGEEKDVRGRRVLFVTIIDGKEEMEIVRAARSSWRAAVEGAGESVFGSELVFAEHVRKDEFQSEILPRNLIVSSEAAVDPAKLMKISSEFAVRHGWEYLLFLNPDLILPPDFLRISLSILNLPGEQQQQAAMAIGMKLDCLFERPLSEIILNGNSTIEKEAKSCEWHSVRISSYLLVRLDTTDINETSIWYWNASYIVDLSPSLMPLQSWPVKQWPRIYEKPQSWAITEMENVIFNLTNQTIIAHVQKRICPQQFDASSYSIQNRNTSVDLLYWYWNAAKQPWMSPHAQGIIEHARRLGCFGHEKALIPIPLSASLEAELTQIGQEILAKADSYFETDPNLEAIAKWIFPFTGIEQTLRKMHQPSCFIYLDGFLIENTPEFTYKYRPLITSVMRRMAMSDKKQIRSFGLCFSGVDLKEFWPGQLRLQAEASKRRFNGFPQFENSFCSYHREVIPGDDGYQNFANFNVVVDNFNFLDFDHPLIAANIQIGRRFYPVTGCNLTFDERNDTLVFRGSPSCCDANRGCRYTNSNFEKLERYSLSPFSRFALVQWSKLHSNLVDAKFSTSYDRSTSPFLFNPDVNKMFEYSPIKSDEYFCEYQKVLVMRGIGAPFRLVQHFKSEQCVFLQHSDCFQWYYRFMKPWIHYVPFRGNLSDLERNIEIVNRTPGLARAIARNGRIFYEKYLSWEPIHNLTTFIIQKIMHGTTGLDELRNDTTFHWSQASRAPYFNTTESCFRLHSDKVIRFGHC